MAGIPMTIGDANKNYISALDPSLDVREIDHNVYDIWREDAFSDILSMGDRKQTTSQPFYISWVNSALFYSGLVTSATNSGTATVTVVMDAAAQGLSRLGGIVYLDDNTSGIITAVSTNAGVDTITVKTDSGVLVIAGGNNLRFGGLLAGEKSIFGQNARFPYEKYSNKIEILRETSQITDIQQAGKLEAHVDGSPSFIVKDHIDKLKRLKASMNQEIFLGRLSTTSFADGTPTLVDPVTNGSGGGGGAVQRTRGLNEYVEVYGTQLEATGSGSAGAPVPNGTVVLADMDNIVDALIAARSTDSQLVMGGTKAKIAFDKLFKNLASSGVTSVRMNIAGRDLDMNVDRVSYGNIEFNFVKMGLLDHPMFSPSDAGKSVFFMPYDKRVPVYTSGDSDMANQLPFMGLRYQPNLGRYGNELISETYTGAFAPNPNGEVQEWKTNWLTKFGLDVKAPSLLVSMKVNA